MSSYGNDDDEEFSGGGDDYQEPINQNPSSQNRITIPLFSQPMQSQEPAEGGEDDYYDDESDVHADDFASYQSNNNDYEESQQPSQQQQEAPAASSHEESKFEEHKGTSSGFSIQIPMAFGSQEFGGGPPAYGNEDKLIRIQQFEESFNQQREEGDNDPMEYDGYGEEEEEAQESDAQQLSQQVEEAGEMEVAGEMAGTGQMEGGVVIQLPQPVEAQEEEEPAVEIKQEDKKKKKKKKKKKDGKSQNEVLVTEFYELVKTKQTVEIDPIDKKMRAQTIMKMKLKDSEKLNEAVKRVQETTGKKVVLIANLLAKMVNIVEVALLSKEKQKTKLVFEYSGPQDQSKFTGVVYKNLNRDLNTFEEKQRLINQLELKEGHLRIKRIMKLKLKGQVEDMFPPTLNLLFTYMIDQITEFGINCVKYKKQREHLTSQDIHSLDQETGLYFYTSDALYSTTLWMPLLPQYLYTPIRWTLQYIVPSKFQVISSGSLILQQSEKSSKYTRCLYLYKTAPSELLTSTQIGFVCGQFPHIHKLSEPVSQGHPARGDMRMLHAFFMSERKADVFGVGPNSLYDQLCWQMVHTLETMLDARYPCSQGKLVFVPNLFKRESLKQSVDFGGGFHLLDEELLFAKNQLENRHKTYKYLGIALSFDFFGNKVFEGHAQDYWLLVAIRQSLGNFFKRAKCGVLLYRYHIMKTIDEVYSAMKLGLEVYPLLSPSQANVNQAECFQNGFFYQKCELIFHMIESMIDKSHFEKILRQLYAHEGAVTSGDFMKVFKEVCGFKLKQFAKNWVLSTSAPKVRAEYSFNKKNNSLDLTIRQVSAVKMHYQFKHFLKEELVDRNILFSMPVWEILPQMRTRLAGMNEFFIELKREAIRWFEGEVNVMLYLTDGAEIQTQQQKMSLKYGKNEVQVNFPLNCKVKKTIQNKKKDFDSYMMMEEEEEEKERSRKKRDARGRNGEKNEDDFSLEQNRLLSQGQVWKFGMNEFELEPYPYTTKNLFEVKNLESPVLWVRVDPDMEFIRRVRVDQSDTSWLFQLLLDRDVIGQIEAIRELGKLTKSARFVTVEKERCLFIYEVLKTVATDEHYFFKVRKEALAGLLQIQTSHFNRFLSLEKILLSHFRSRNYLPQIDFFRSNDFSNLLEYYMDKRVLKSLARCKEKALGLKKSVQDVFDNMEEGEEEQKLQHTTLINISLNPVSEQLQVTAGVPQQEILKKRNEVPRDEDVCLSSEAVAQLFLKLFKENDNSLNAFDDNFYLATIVKAMGNLDNFEFMPEIAREIHRAYQLDKIGQFSAQFALAKGAICAHYKMRKQLFLFETKKIHNLDDVKENFDQYFSQIKIIRDLIQPMDREVALIQNDAVWPLELRVCVFKNEIRHKFKYSNFAFLVLFQITHLQKAMYLTLQTADRFQMQCDYSGSLHVLQCLSDFLARNFFVLEFREAYMDNERSRAIEEILWNFLSLPHAYLEGKLIFWAKRLYYQLYFNEVVPFLKDYCMGKEIGSITFDNGWMRYEEAEAGRKVYEERKNQMNKAMTHRYTQGNKIVLNKDPNYTPSSSKVAKPTNASDKLKIFVGEQERQQPSNLRIDLRSNYLPPPQIQNQYENRMAIDEQNEGDEDESIYDEFDEVKFQGWMQSAWEILGLLWYHEEAGAFLEPVSERDLGAYFQQYLMLIEYPMDFTTIKKKMYAYEYRSFHDFKIDVLQVFKNCMIFNDENSELYLFASNLKRMFLEKIEEYQIEEEDSRIHIS